MVFCNFFMTFTLYLFFSFSGAMLKRAPTDHRPLPIYVLRPNISSFAIFPACLGLSECKTIKSVECPLLPLTLLLPHTSASIHNVYYTWLATLLAFASTLPPYLDLRTDILVMERGTFVWFTVAWFLQRHLTFASADDGVLAGATNASSANFFSPPSPSLPTTLTSLSSQSPSQRW